MIIYPLYGIPNSGVDPLAKESPDSTQIGPFEFPRIARSCTRSGPRVLRSLWATS